MLFLHMEPLQHIPDIPNLIHYAIPFFVLTVILEILITSKKKMQAYTFKDGAASISMGIGNVLIGLFAKALATATRWR